jgi:predicted site-specific integrase-resolvase
MKLIPISKLAKDLNVNIRTIWNWYYQNKIQFIKNEMNTRNYVSCDTYNNLLNIKNDKKENVIIYCRVSSSQNKDNLESQAERLKNYCIINGYKINNIIKEIGSGLNDNRPKLLSILNDTSITKIVVEHKDRLTRVGFNYIETLLNNNNIQIEVVNNSQDDEENIINDFVSIITSYCARIYGKRRSKRKTEELLRALKNDNQK